MLELIYPTRKCTPDAFVSFPIFQIHFVLIYPVSFYCFLPTVHITCTYSSLFPFTKPLLNPFVPNCFLQFFLLLLLTYYRFSLVFMKRPNNKLFLYKLVSLLLTWTWNVCRNCCLKNCKLKNTYWIKEKEQEKKTERAGYLMIITLQSTLNLRILTLPLINVSLFS